MTKYPLKEIDNIEDLKDCSGLKDDIIVHCVFNTLTSFKYKQIGF